MDADPGQSQALCNRATHLEHTVADLALEAMAAAVITFAEACSYAADVEDGLRRRRPRSARPRPRHLRAVGSAPRARPR
jgi:hypothetical protein